MPDKVSPGQRRSQGPLAKAGFVNELVDTINHRSLRGSGPPHPSHLLGPLGTDFLFVRNDSGDTRERGDVLQLGDLIDDSEGLFDPYLEADTPAAPPGAANLPFTVPRKCVILADGAAEDSPVKAHCSGACVAKVNVISTSHTHAEPVAGQHALRSAWYGPIELLSPANGTGEQLMAVRFQPQWPLARWYGYATNENIASTSWVQVGDWGTFGIDPVGIVEAAGGHLSVRAPGLYAVRCAGTFQWESGMVAVGNVGVEFGLGTFTGAVFSPMFTTGPLTIPYMDPVGDDELRGGSAQFALTVHMPIEENQLVDLMYKTSSSAGSTQLYRAAYLTIEQVA